jgi:hypothetical protein
MEEEIPTNPENEPPAAAADTIWLVSYSQTDDREMTPAEILRALTRGEISERTIVWREGMPEWKAIADTGDLGAILNQAGRPNKQRTVIGGFAATGLPAPAEDGTPTVPLASSLKPRAPRPDMRPNPTEAARPLEKDRVEPPDGAPDHQQAENTARPLTTSEDEPPTLRPSSLTALGASSPEDAGGSGVLAPSPEAESSPTTLEESALESLPPGTLDAPPQASPEPQATRSVPAPNIFDIELPSPSPAREAPPAPPRPRDTDRAGESVLAAAPSDVAPPNIDVFSQQGLNVPGATPSTTPSAAPPERLGLSTWLLLLVVFAALGGAALLVGRETAKRTADAHTEQVVAPSATPAASVAPASATASLSATATSAASEAPSTSTSAAPTTTASVTAASETGPRVTEPAATKGSRPTSAAEKPATKSPVASPQKEEPAKKKTEEQPEDTTTSPPAAFDRNAATAALNQAAASASSCRKPGDPSGVANVSVTFSTSGRATRAVLSGPPFAGTATGGCIASKLRGARIPKFAGDRVTVRKRVVIQ